MSYDMGVRPAVESRRQQLGWLNRLFLVALAVALCHCFAWTWLRALTQQSNLAVDALFGVYMQPLTATTISFQGVFYHYQVSCTFVDVWFGLIPLIWMKQQSVQWNVCWLSGWAVGLFVFNVARLSLSDILFAYGIPWWLAHAAFSGVCYYFVWRVAQEAMASQQAV
jgi:hypothetical protein